MKTNRYVQHTEKNLKVFSSEFARIILVTCAEIDTVCRLLCKEIDPSCNFSDDSIRSGDIKEYSKIILDKYPKLINTEIYSNTLQRIIKPWEGWISVPNYQSPEWWKGYQLLKHYRHLHFEEATLEKALYSASALFVILMYLHKTAYNFTADEKNIDWPSCFISRSMQDINGSSDYMDDVEQLPDF